MIKEQIQSTNLKVTYLLTFFTTSDIAIPIRSARLAEKVERPLLIWFLKQ